MPILIPCARIRLTAARQVTACPPEITMAISASSSRYDSTKCGYWRPKTPANSSVFSRITGIASSIARARSSCSGGPCSGWICGPCERGRRGSSGNGSWYGGRNSSTCAAAGISTSPAMCDTK